MMTIFQSCLSHLDLINTLIRVNILGDFPCSGISCDVRCNVKPKGCLLRHRLTRNLYELVATFNQFLVLINISCDVPCNVTLNPVRR